MRLWAPKIRLQHLALNTHPQHPQLCAQKCTNILEPVLQSVTSSAPGLCCSVPASVLGPATTTDVAFFYMFHTNGSIHSAASEQPLE